jgi:crotonobetainyl-CoA:carnitine CoA-transferase CaiB-like acyl-CoA transferase
MVGPLTGIRIVELGTSLAVGYAGKLFSDLGAEVTQVNTSKHEEWSAPASALSLYLSAHKKAADVDLSSESGEVQLCDFLTQSCLVLQASNEQCYVEGKWSPERISQTFPHLIVVSVTPFGLKGEARMWSADDLTLQAISGISIGIGSPGRAPLKLPGDQSAFQAGLAAAIAGLGALFQSKGMLLDVSAADVWASFYTGVEVALAHFGRHLKKRSGHRAAGQPYPRTIYRCKDGYFAIQCGESRHWQGFLRMIGREDLATHALFSNRFKANDEHGDACDALVEPWFASRTKEDVLCQCLKHRIPGAPVYDIAEVYGHPHLNERGYFVPASLRGQTSKLPGHPYGRLNAEPGRYQQGRETVLTSGQNDALRPLKGLRVLDFGWVWAGAVPGHILADMGAEVIKIESAKPLDYMRQGRPIVGTQKDPEQNPMFQNVNRGKLSLRINFDHAETRKVLEDLVTVSDVVIENFSPGVMEKFGLNYPKLKQLRPDLVMCSMSAVGQHGPLRGIRTYATMIASLAGIDALVGYPGERVLGSQSSYADPNASLHATFGILAALWRRERSGVGAYLDVSQWEAAVCVMSEAATEFALHGRVPAMFGTLHEYKSPHGNYRAAGDDQWIAISVSNDMQWGTLGQILGGSAWMSAESFSTVKARLVNRAALDEALEQETRKYEASSLAAKLSSRGVPAAPLLDASGVAKHKIFADRKLFENVAHPVLKSVPVYRLPWQVNGNPIPITRRAPLLGEHNNYALQDLLGYSRDRVQALQNAGVFA